MQAHIWGIKTFYYSLIDKQGSKAEVKYTNGHEVENKMTYTEIEMEEDCDSCVL